MGKCRRNRVNLIPRLFVNHGPRYLGLCEPAYDKYFLKKRDERPLKKINKKKKNQIGKGVKTKIFFPPFWHKSIRGSSIMG